MHTEQINVGVQFWACIFEAAGNRSRVFQLKYISSSPRRYIISAGDTAVGSYLPQITLAVKSAYSIWGLWGYSVILALALVALTKASRFLPQSSQGNVGILSPNRPWPLHFQFIIFQPFYLSYHKTCPTNKAVM